MNVSELKTPKAGLNGAKVSQSPVKSGRWNDALNDAAASREAASLQPPDANRAKMTTAQKSRAQAGLNGRTGVGRAGRPSVGEGPVLRPDKPTAAQANAPAVAVDEKRLHARKDPKALEKSAHTLVNQFFMGSMLKQMRASPFKTDTFSGGKAGAAYAGMFDSHVAQHGGNRLAKSLVTSMVKQYQRNATPTLGLSA